MGSLSLILIGVWCLVTTRVEVSHTFGLTRDTGSGGSVFPWREGARSRRSREAEGL